jgi:hypothetical protein
MAIEQKTSHADPEALGYDWAEWRPSKLIIARTPEYTILKSLPDQSTYETIQFSIRRRSYKDDVARIDSYKEGYFAVNWHSTIPLARFLDVTEKFMAKFESTPVTKDTQDERYNLMLFVKGQDPSEYIIERPLTENDISENIDTNQLSFPRINSPFVDFCYSPRTETLGLIAGSNPSSNRDIFPAVANSVSQTQPVLTGDIILNVLHRMPYFSEKNS